MKKLIALLLVLATLLGGCGGAAEPATRTCVKLSEPAKQPSSVSTLCATRYSALCHLAGKQITRLPSLLK
jgi:hypothetical protein